jgi:hypothetical protein
LAGWEGTEQVWYRRAFAGKTMATAELWPMTWAFLGRFLVLGFLSGLPLLVGAALSSGADGVVGWVGRVLVSVMVFGALTFVAPALAFSTRWVHVAVPKGVRLLRNGWPATARYAAVAVVAGASWLVPLPGVAGALVRLLVGALGQLAVTGAVVAWYLRREKTGEDGAAYRDPVDRPVRPVRKRHRRRSR